MLYVSGLLATFTYFNYVGKGIWKDHMLEINLYIFLFLFFCLRSFYLPIDFEIIAERQTYSYTWTPAGTVFIATYLTCLGSERGTSVDNFALFHSFYCFQQIFIKFAYLDWNFLIIFIIYVYMCYVCIKI